MPHAITAGQDIELDLLRDWREPLSFRRVLRDGGVSIAIHLVVVSILVGILSMPPPRYRAVEITTELRKAVPLYVPRELTQRAPNVGEVTHNVDVESSMATPPHRTPKFHPPAPAPGPIAQIQQPTVVESPRVDTQGTQPPTIGLPDQIPVPAAPAPQQKSKMVLQNVGDEVEDHPVHIDPKLLPPKDSIGAATRAAMQHSAGALGYDGEGRDTAMQIPQLLSDPNGVDFRPYLQMIARTVKTNWLKILPRGLRGRVSVQFIIDRNGRVVKVVISSPSETPAFDRYAVDGISQVGQFPPLPAEFTGPTISLQITFSAH